MGIKIITPPVAEPLTIDECRAQLRIVAIDFDSDGNGTHPDDTAIMATQTEAREWIEDYLEASVAAKTYELRLDAWPDDDEVDLRMVPVFEIVQVSYIDAEMVEQTVDGADYVLDDWQRVQAWLLPAVSTDWPGAANVINAVRIQFRAGYGVPGDDSDPPELPGSIRAALKLLLTHLWENRNEPRAADVPQGVYTLLGRKRTRLTMA